MGKWTLLAVTPLLAGCLEMEVSVTLRADGSGQQALRLGMSDAVIDRLRQAAQAVAASAPRRDPLQVYDEREVRAELEDQGLRVASYRTWRERRRRFVEIEAEFPGLAALAKSSLLGGSCECYLLAGRNAGGVRLVLYPQGHAAWREAIDRAEQIAAQPDEVQRRFFEQQRSRLRGLDLRLRLDLPGDVDYCSVNLDETGPRQVTAVVREGDIDTAEALVRALAPRFEVEFDGSGCSFELDAAEPPLPPKKVAKESSG